MAIRHKLPAGFSGKNRKFRRSVSAEPLSYPFNWVIETTTFRQSIKQFKNNLTAVQYHEKPTVTEYLIKYEQNSPIFTISHDQSSAPTLSNTRTSASFTAAETFIKFTSMRVIMGEIFFAAQRAEWKQMI